MSKVTTYKCDLCKTETGKELLFAMYYDNTIQNEKGKYGAYLLTTNVEKSDKHICTDCIQLIRKSTKL